LTHHQINVPSTVLCFAQFDTPRIAWYNQIMKKYHDLSNKQFGRLAVISPSPRPVSVKGRDKYWVCICACGNEIVVAARSLKTGHTSSCGCLQKERAAQSCKITNTTHGQSRVGKTTKEYRAWCSMIGRCENPSNHAFLQYGGRGITVYQEWRTSFESFLADVGQSPSAEYSIDRINNDGNYEPGNVRWATGQEQSRNRRDRKPITYKGKTQPLVDWSNETGIHISTLHSRLYKYGWNVNRALETDPNLYHRK